MMGTIVLSMLLGWFGVVAILTLLSGRQRDPLAEESAAVASAQPGAPDEASAGVSV
jgi:hypothetical protein